MPRCEVFVTTKNGSVVAGAINLEDGRIWLEVTPGYEVLMESVSEDPCWVDGGTRQVNRDDDPQEWFAALPANYHGSALQAEMV